MINVYVLETFLCFLGPVVVLSNVQCRGVLLILILVRQQPTVLAVGAGGRCLVSIISLFFHEKALYRLKSYLKKPINPNLCTIPRYPDIHTRHALHITCKV